MSKKEQTKIYLPDKLMSMDDSDVSILFTSRQIGSLEVRNRFIRSATQESMATTDGEVTEQLVDLHSRLAEGGVGLQITGHTYVDNIGKHSHHQTGMHHDSLLPGLRRLTEKVHSKGGLILAQLNHTGSQKIIDMDNAMGPSAVVCPSTGVVPREASEHEIWETVKRFGDAARRVRDAGFDGLHVHAAHGYLISQFSSPYSNRRVDEWGGSQEKRDKFLMEVYREIRKNVGSNFPIIIKLGIEDKVTGGVRADESIRRAALLEAEGVSAIEVSCGVMSGSESAQKYVAVNTRRAVSDLLFHRIFRSGAPEAYFLPYARAIKKRLRIPIVLVGGIRTTQTMSAIVKSGDADFLSLARPFIRQPDLVKLIQSGRRGVVDCTSCNLCIEHDGEFELKCWRKSPLLLSKHIYYKFHR